MIKHCILKEQKECFYLNEYNKYEFINILSEYYNIVSINFEDENEYIMIRHSVSKTDSTLITTVYSYYNWYLKKCDINGVVWKKYSKKDFFEIYQVID